MDNKKLMRKQSILSIISILIIASSCNKAVTDFSPNPKQMLLSEWVSFNVCTAYYEDGELQFERYNSRVIIHNGSTENHEIAFVNEDGSMALITPTEITYINNDYKVIGKYNKADFFYSELVMDMLQGALDYFPMYYESEGCAQITCDSLASGFEVFDGDTLYTVPATKLERHCYANGTCRLKEAPITLFFGTRYGGFIKARQTLSKWPTRKEYVSTITEIAFDDCSRIVDSLFYLDAEIYKDYDFVSGDKFLPYREATDNTKATSEVLNHAIVNLTSGDTTALAKMSGDILLCIFDFGLNESTYNEIESLAKGVDNVVWLMPASDNTKKLKEMEAVFHLGNDIYYTKGFNTLLSEFNRYYFFDKKHQIVSYEDGNDFKQWIEKLIK